MNARHLSPSVHQPRHSGTHLSGAAAVRALVDAQDSVAREGGVDPIVGAVHILRGLNAAKPYHWAALASMAGTPMPDQHVQDLVQAVYVKRCQ